MSETKNEMGAALSNLTIKQREIIKTGVTSNKKMLNMSWDYLANKQLPKKERDLIAFALFRRVDELHQGVIVLSDFYEPVSSYVINRTISETFAILKGVCTEEKFYLEYYNKNAKGKIKNLKNLITDLSQTSFNVSVDELQEIQQETEDSINKEQPILADARQLFGRFSLHDLYHDTFAHCSLYTHTDSQTLDMYLNMENNDIQICDNKNLFKDVVLTLSMSSRLYINSFEEITQFLKVENKKLAEEFVKMYYDYQAVFAEDSYFKKK